MPSDDSFCRDEIAIMVAGLTLTLKIVKGINLDTIRKLASIVLKENVFAYQKKIYKQTTGGAMGSSLTLILANIFM
jgi:hypothetical protein